MIVSGLLILIHLDNAVHFSVKAKSENGSTQFFWGKDASGDTLRFRKVNEKKTDIITRQSIFKARATGVLQGEELQANWFPYSQRFAKAICLLMPNRSYNCGGCEISQSYALLPQLFFVWQWLRRKERERQK
ncbi:uncharacterized protein LOC130780947 isoform X1 [Actinidia eriantha]|uniref:uncharacterized protein LOC130780947 isoform X1 n=1 Tax=Actinidia eriantha TaxID=165200 RepID=UPI002583D90B|nr:uncharacterized protein LOC130780947 isoform X1 [Actinidia eriantha]